MKRYKSGRKGIEVLLARRDELMRIEVKLGSKPSSSWDIEVVPDAAEDVVARRDAWLAGSAATGRKQRRR